MLSGIRGLRLHIMTVTAKFKYDDHNPVRHRESIAGRLDRRAKGRDHGAAGQQRRRLAERGEWRVSRDAQAEVGAPSGTSARA
jgi:transcriptional regulator